MPRLVAIVILVFCPTLVIFSQGTKQTSKTYPTIWFAPINDPNKPGWEILPQEAKLGEMLAELRSNDEQNDGKI